MILVVEDTEGQCPDDCDCEDSEDYSLVDSLEACQNACLVDSSCLSIEYQERRRCKLCTQTCSTNLLEGPNYWCYKKTDSLVATGKIFGFLSFFPT
jgi:MinD superfamily P-loop ATPase